jgi:hypothetical protein
MSDSGSGVGADLGSRSWSVRPCGADERPRKQGRVEIANVEAALERVRGFIALLKQNHDLWNATASGAVNPKLKQSNDQVHEQLPLIRQIAARSDTELHAKLEDGITGGTYGWPYHGVLQTSQQLAGLLNSVEEAEQILGPVGPKPAAASLHPWIWNAAVSLWDDGHLREAVQAAAVALFDSHLPAKLGVPAGRSAKDLAAQAFSADPPAAGSPRLRLADYPEASASWISQHEGARFFGMGCAQLIRNLVTHGAQPDEQTALEQLASLSLLARLIDRAKKITL